MTADSISFKGTRDGLIVTLGDGEWHEMLNELAMQLSRPAAQSFFQGARVLLETGSRAVGIVELEELIALLSQHGMLLASIIGEKRTQEALEALRSTMPAPAEPVAQEPVHPPIVESEFPADASQALFIHRTIRSGQVVRYPGTVIIIGDVNPGAEVIADGDIIIWGKLRGVAHAGVSGDASAIIGALILTPTQLRIGEHIAHATDDKHTRNWQAEVARVRQGKIIVESWNSPQGLGG